MPVRAEEDLIWEPPAKRGRRCDDEVRVETKSLWSSASWAACQVVFDRQDENEPYIALTLRMLSGAIKTVLHVRSTWAVVEVKQVAAKEIGQRSHELDLLFGHTRLLDGWVLANAGIVKDMDITLVINESAPYIGVSFPGTSADKFAYCEKYGIELADLNSFFCYCCTINN